MENKKTVIISLQDDNDELKRLAESLDYVVVKIFVQHHSTPNRSFYIGKGKIEEVKEYLEGKGIDYVIVNGKLTPSQWYNMEKELNAIVYDRIRLILDIFADRAKRKEAKLQVKLAYLRYEKPYIKELVHKIRAGEHPGFMAGGEYEVANYYEMIKKQIKKIRKELEKIERERESHYEYRWKKGYYLVTIAGYTNAGKSSLLNNLTGENVKVEERLFSTLSTTTRAIKKRDAPILITDTVGFIKDIPHWLIDSFKSTLKGIELSDVVVLLVDISEENNTIVDKINLSVKEIMEINANQKIVIGFNKIDKISKKER
ncbi:MAG: GTPase HflX, partial [Thermoplasmata archaeon]